MPFDTAVQAAMVIRKVEDVTHQGQPCRAVVASRDYATDIDDLWNAITDKARIPRWFAPVEGDLELGGKYQIKGNAGGTVTACEPPRKFALTWEFGGGMSWVEVELAEAGGRTQLTLRHIAPRDGKSEEFWDQFGPGAVGVGWDLSLLGLAWHLETGEAVQERFAEATWPPSAEGQTFVGASSDDWAAASIAYGTDGAAAHRAATATTAFFTGVPAPE
jgi:uncharacterized protein YndB with AHSA1/START domain